MTAAVRTRRSKREQKKTNKEYIGSDYKKLKAINRRDRRRGKTYMIQE
jgi:hypothetical protein